MDDPNYISTGEYEEGLVDPPAPPALSPPTPAPGGVE